MLAVLSFPDQRIRSADARPRGASRLPRPHHQLLRGRLFHPARASATLVAASILTAQNYLMFEDLHLLTEVNDSLGIKLSAQDEHVDGQA
jgi:hypothetical protein